MSGRPRHGFLGRNELFLAAVVCALAGCGPAPNRQKGTAEKGKVEAKVAQTIESASGNALSKGPPPKRTPQWYVEWETASVHIVTSSSGTTGPISGAAAVTLATMNGVSGNLFDGDKPSSTFRADEGVADGAKRILTLEGHIRLESPSPEAVLTCDRVVYDAAKNLIRAQGHVKVEGKVGTVGTLSEIWATPRLDRIATPGMFYKK